MEDRVYAEAKISQSSLLSLLSAWSKQNLFLDDGRIEELELQGDEIFIKLSKNNVDE